MRGTALLGVVATLLAEAPLAGQSDSLLDAAVRLASEGRGDSARHLVRRVLDGTRPTDSLYARALFTSGVVAFDTDHALRAFQRVVVEYGLSSWADDAMLRLIQLSQAAGDPGATAGWFERFRLDHAGSPHLASAAYWGARAYFDLRDEARGCAALRDGLAAAGADVEAQHRLRFYAQRCAAPAADGTNPPAGPSGPYFTVQVLAAKSVAAADEMLTTLRNAGFEATVTRDSDGLLKVRVGRFATRDEAGRMATQLRQRLRIEPFVTEVTP